MRRLFCLGAAAALLAVLAFNAPATDAAGKTFLYVHDNGTPNEVHGFRFGSDGSLTELPGSPFDTGASPGVCGGMCQTLTFAKKGKLLFAGTQDGIVVFRIAKDGSLSQVAGSPFGGAPITGVAAVQKKGKVFVYGADAENDEIRAFQVNSDGSLTELAGSPHPTGDEPVGVTATVNGLFTANEDEDSISAFRINNNGTLTEAPNSPFFVGSPSSFIYNVHATPDGRFLYTGDASETQVFGFLINPVTADLTELPGSPFDADVDTGWGLAVGKGDVIVAPGGSELQAFRYPKTTGNLTALGGAQSANGINLDGGILDPKGRYVIGGSSSSDVLRVFEINRTNGVLTEVESQSVPLEPGDLNGMVFAK